MDPLGYAGAIPLTTISMVIIIVAFRREVWEDSLEMMADHFKVTKTVLLISTSLIILGIMLVCSLITHLFFKYLERQRAAAAADIVFQQEKEALIELFRSLGGDCWRDKTRWCSDEPIYRWKGVHLHPETKRVQKLILADNNLEGFFQHF
jgi:hypothetical protein